MKYVSSKHLVVGLIAFTLLAFGVNSYAYKEMAGQKTGKRCSDCAKYGQSGGCVKAGAAVNLTTEQREQIDAERTAFIEATKDERDVLNEKRTALWEEIAKEEPDVQKASVLQEEISELHASLDQKMLTHILAVRKINPDAGRRFFSEHRGGYGRGTGLGNCPYRQ